MATSGDSVVLECAVDAQPKPKMMFWRDPDGRVPVIQGGKYEVDIIYSKEVSTFVVILFVRFTEQKIYYGFKFDRSKQST